jgi:hypothetical protein
MSYTLRLLGVGLRDLSPTTNAKTSTTASRSAGTRSSQSDGSADANRSPI